MRLIKTLIIFYALAAVQPVMAAEKSRDEMLAERPDMISVSEEDKQMNAAIGEARRNVPKFLAMLERGGPEAASAGFKFPLGGWEHIWVDEVQRDGEFLTGRLANVPVQEGWKLGDDVRIPAKDISDWAWRNADGVMQGHYTTRVLLDMMPADEAADLRKALGW